MKTTFFFRYLAISACCFSLASCGHETRKTYWGTVERTDVVGSISYFYSDSFILEMSKGVIDITITTLVYSGDQKQEPYIGRRLVCRHGVYTIVSSVSEILLDVPLADVVTIGQSGKGFSEFSSDDPSSLISINTKYWTSSMAKYGFSSPEQIRNCFGHPCEIIVSSSPDDVSQSEFSIEEFPPIFVGLDENQ